jgi:hypothetical protein
MAMLQLSTTTAVTTTTTMVTATQQLRAREMLWLNLKPAAVRKLKRRAPSVQQADASDEADAGDEADAVAFDSGTHLACKHSFLFQMSRNFLHANLE